MQSESTKSAQSPLYRVVRSALLASLPTKYAIKVGFWFRDDIVSMHQVNVFYTLGVIWARLSRYLETALSALLCHGTKQRKSSPLTAENRN